jgi:hypothetical protein
MLHKEELTSRLVELLPNDNQITVDQALKTWYMNLRKTGGLRLTEQGYQALKMLDIESWPVSIELSQIDKRGLLSLDQKITFPYYIDTRKKQVIMFSSREAMLATLYNDLKQFLSNYSGL